LVLSWDRSPPAPINVTDFGVSEEYLGALENVLSPAIVCVPVVKTPPKEALAGCRFRVEPVKVAAFALGVDPIADSAETAAVPLDAAVTKPFAFTVKFGFVKEPTLEFTVASVSAVLPVASPV
jgi:hypothetical protein